MSAVHEHENRDWQEKEQVDRIADFLSTVKISEVIGNKRYANAPAPCPKCGANEIFIGNASSYWCICCGDYGNAPQYLIEREGFELWAAIVEIALRTNRPVPEYE